VSRVMENYKMAANGRFDAVTALITGGASGIGLAVASRVIAEGGLVTLGTSTKPSSTRRKSSSAPSLPDGFLPFRGSSRGTRAK
jgi:hypothetical protein